MGVITATNGCHTTCFTPPRTLVILVLELHTIKDTVAANLVLSRDTAAYLDFHTPAFPMRDGMQVYPDALDVYGMKYQFAWNDPVFVSDSSVVFDQLLITHEDMQLSLDGDLNAFDISFDNIDLTKLNQFYFHDSTVITNGHLHGMISYLRDQQLDLKANVDSQAYIIQPLLPSRRQPIRRK
ncbi:MAG: hypothetical protein IPL92_20015 [Saprospiraceae bacterium]|nr:hypothetical protein [Candidatus Opimibacter iunctus]